MGRCGLVGSTLVFGSTVVGLNRKNGYFSRHAASAAACLIDLGLQQAERTGAVPITV